MVGKTNVKALWCQVRDYPNVIGYAPKLVRRIRSGKERSGGFYFRVYVNMKQPEDMLDACDVLPIEINGIPVDVVGFNNYFKDDIILNGEFILMDDAYIGESCFLFHSSL